MVAKKMKQQTAAEKAVHNATAAERRALEKYRARHEEKRAVKLTLSDSGDQLELDHSDKLIGEALLVEALGSVHKEFVNGILNQLADLNKDGQAINEPGLNFMLAVINGVEPRNQLEAMLAVQMAASRADHSKGRSVSDPTLMKPGPKSASPQPSIAVHTRAANSALILIRERCRFPHSGVLNSER